MNAYHTLARVLDFYLGKTCTNKDIAQLNQSLFKHDNLVELAECHGVAPLFYAFIKKHNLSLALNTRRQLQSLSLRHNHAALAREQIIIQILNSFRFYNIDLILLKGIALAYSVFSKPEYRPMRDIDLLVPKAKLMKAKDVLTDIGFVFEDAHPSAYMVDMHHLPNAVKFQDGFNISLELHHQVYSRDMSVTQSYPQAKSTVRSIMINNEYQAQTLGHVSMLNHLCRHAFGPGDEVRLIHQYDILSYANKFAADIHWEKIHAESPFVINTIRCLHFSLTLPASMNDVVRVPETKTPSGIGQSMPVYSKILKNKTTFLAHLKKTVLPSGWWMHVNYNVPPEKSLFWCYVFTHPKRLMVDLLARLASIMQVKLGRAK